jgi:hypothetical protein
LTYIIYIKYNVSRYRFAEPLSLLALDMKWRDGGFALKKRILFTTCVLLLLLASAPLFAQGAGLRFEISPIMGIAGTEVSITGEMANPDLPVRLLLVRDESSSSDPLAVVEVEPDADGTFEAALTIPQDTPTGSYALRGEQLDSSGEVLSYWWVDFRVAADVSSRLPETGKIPGTQLTITMGLAILLTLSLLGRGIYAIMHPEIS